MKILSINKTFINQIVKPLPSLKVNKILINGEPLKNVIKPILKQKTNKGKQLVEKYRLKKLYNIKKVYKAEELHKKLDVILFEGKMVSSIKEAQNWIKQGKIKINEKVIKNRDYIVPKLSLITINNKKIYENKLAHSIKQVLEKSQNLISVSSQEIINL